MTINSSQACNLNKTYFKCCLLRELNAVLIQLIWICQLQVRFLVPVRFLHLPIRFRVYFFVAADDWICASHPRRLCTADSAAYLCRVPAGRTVNTRYYKCNDCLILYTLYPGPASLICKPGHPPDTSHNHSHSLASSVWSQPRLEMCKSLKRNYCHFLLTLIQNGL